MPYRFYDCRFYNCFISSQWQIKSNAYFENLPLLVNKIKISDYIDYFYFFKLSHANIKKQTTKKKLSLHNNESHSQKIDLERNLFFKNLESRLKNIRTANKYYRFYMTILCQFIQILFLLKNFIFLYRYWECSFACEMII